MTSRLVKLYAGAAAAVGFTVAWAGVASHPFPDKPATASAQQATGVATAQQVAQVNARARALQKKAARVNRLMASHQAAQKRASAAAVQIQTISLPAVTVTRTS